MTYQDYIKLHPNESVCAHSKNAKIIYVNGTKIDLQKVGNNRQSICTLQKK